MAKATKKAANVRMAPLAECIAYAKSQTFQPECRVRGVLVNSIVGNICTGNLFGADLPDAENFVRFEAVGTDNRDGYDIVQAANGVAYIVLTFEDCWLGRLGMSHLKNHISINKDWYQARKAATWG